MKVGIVIETRKQKIFEKLLTEAGYSFKRGKGLIANSMNLYVEIDDHQVGAGEPEKLAAVVRKAQEKAALSKLN